MGRKGKLASFGDIETGSVFEIAISPKPEGSRPPKLVCMYVTSTPTCMIFFEPILSN